MARDPRYDVLFEPVKIGPKTARNRFYQVPHCNGMGHLYPNGMAAMRGTKAEGGWAVVCTEECEIHPSSDYTPVTEMRLWDDGDMPVHQRVVDNIHAHGALAGTELVHNSHDAPNRFSREVPLSPSHQICIYNDPVQARAMDKQDIRDFRRWHRDAAVRAEKIGYDIIYLYVAHNITMLTYFLSRRYNDRVDEYGGSFENRLRLLRETLEETKEAVGHNCAIAVRFAVDELMGEKGITHDGEGRAVIEALAELPDLWDVNIAGWENDSVTARFAEEGYQEEFISFVKQVTTKPVVGVGRYTSPDRMVSLVENGVLDFIGAARPSIADPFLPRKIEEGRLEDIRECIGCNICVSCDFLGHPLRCTQNPTMGEEWRRGWHPEKIAAKGSNKRVLVVGAGPAGLEATRALGERGYDVMLAEATRDLGGRVTLESRLPGMAAYARVRDYRVQQIERMTHVEVFRESEMTVESVLELAPDHVVIATGAQWRRDGVGRQHTAPIPGSDMAPPFTPDDILAGRLPDGPVLLYDDDHYYMTSVIAERLCAEGLEVIYVTPAADVANWTHNTMEQPRIQARLIELGVEIRCAHNLVAIETGAAVLSCVYTGRETRRDCAAIVSVTARLPNDALYLALAADAAALDVAGIGTLNVIGDACAPAAVVHAVYAGHRYARELDEPRPDGLPFKRERVALTLPP
jgi:dimethylamine/trimethylamine dehydrogenase